MFPFSLLKMSIRSLCVRGSNMTRIAYDIKQAYYIIFIQAIYFLFISGNFSSPCSPVRGVGPSPVRLRSSPRTVLDSLKAYLGFIYLMATAGGRGFRIHNNFQTLVQSASWSGRMTCETPPLQRHLNAILTSHKVGLRFLLVLCNMDF